MKMTQKTCTSGADDSAPANENKKWDHESLKHPLHVAKLLMFDGVAEQAMNFYVSLFSGSAIKRVEKYGPDEAGAEGTVKRADFTLRGHNLICIDSPAKHDFNFTPAISIFVECMDENEQQTALAQLSADGTELMPLDNYGFSRRFAWVNDRFGVSWQLNLQ
jgi:predicted 3-demethylubiquinone-9 3-methyltransferase (glyoxalase superfamily)